MEDEINEKILAVRRAIGALAKAKRTSLGKTQSKLAKESGLSDDGGSAISDLENSKTWIGGVKHPELVSSVFAKLEVQNADAFADLYKALRELWVSRGNNLTT